jgi:uncharacterized protein YPO0396
MIEDKKEPKEMDYETIVAKARAMVGENEYYPRDVLNCAEAITQLLKERDELLKYQVTHPWCDADIDHLNDIIAERTKERDQLKGSLTAMKILKDEAIENMNAARKMYISVCSDHDYEEERKIAIEDFDQPWADVNYPEKK